MVAWMLRVVASPPESPGDPSRVLLDQVTVLAALLRELEDGCPDALARARAFIRGQLVALADGGEPRTQAFIRARQGDRDKPAGRRFNRNHPI